MLLARFASLATRTARGRRALWRTWYQFLAARYREPGWTFMNYGYRDPGGAAGPALDPADEADRSFIQLYDVVARGAPVANRDLLLVQAIVMLLVVAVLFVNFVVDILYAVLDPRLRHA